MPRIPQESALDSTLALMADPYGFIGKRCDKHQSDLFQARIMLQPTLCMRGRAASELFYGTDRMMRKGAAPEPLKKTLLGVGGVQGLDDAQHQHRKRMFLSVVPDNRVQELADLSTRWLITYATQWKSQPQVTLYPQFHEILCRSVCAWAGVPLPEAEVAARTREMTALFDRAGAKGLGHLWARLARQRSESWIAGVIRDIRAGRLQPPPESAASIIAQHRELNGQLLSEKIAAVELLNVLRPVIAVSVFLVFVAHALHTYPDVRQRLLEQKIDDRSFVQEVRRFYPFFPAAVAKTRENFEWNGYQFPAGRRVMLALYATNHDQRSWDQPQEFRPERFIGGKEDLFSFIPQGGGQPEKNHRCPGETIAIALMQRATQFFLKQIQYQVPPQDLQIDFRRMPALPVSRFIISEVVFG